MVNSGHRPGQTKTKEYIDRIRASHVSNGIIGVGLVGSSDFGSKKIWKGRAEGDQGDRINGGLNRGFNSGIHEIFNIDSRMRI